MDIICGRIYIGELTNACIGIENGKIVKIKKNLEGRKIDYGNLVIFPAGIDVHVHFREPGYEYKEDFFTGSRAAALAGITCVLDMPNNMPPIINKERFNEKVKKIKNKACIDYGLYGGIRKDGKMEDMDCIGYKIYLTEVSCPIENVLKELKKFNKPVAVHAEYNINEDKIKNLEEHERNRGKECELTALKRLIEANEKIGVKMHICHITTSDSIDIIKNRTSYGVTLHHLLFSYERKFKVEAMGKVNPPLRSEEERKKLYERFIKGDIPILESDHAPHSFEEKKKIWDAPSGMPGVDALLPIMLYKVKRGLNIDLLYKMVCKNPSDFFGINKGSIQVGKDADFIIIDFKKESKIKALSKCGWSCYEGMKCIYPKHVYLRGNKIVENGEFVGDKGKGKMIK